MKFMFAAFVNHVSFSTYLILYVVCLAFLVRFSILLLLGHGTLHDRSLFFGVPDGFLDDHLAADRNAQAFRRRSSQVDPIEGRDDIHALHNPPNANGSPLTVQEIACCTAFRTGVNGLH